MNKGYLHTVVWVVLASLLALLLLYWLPQVSVGDWEMRKIDLLADVRPDTADVDVADISAPVAARERVDSCPPGKTCIHDYATLDERGMTPLYEAIANIQSLGRPVRIAVLGDSYIEGDILTANLREELQKRYGGAGVGFVPMATGVEGFRKSVRQTTEGWTAHHGNEPHNYSTSGANLTGSYFYADVPSSISLHGVRGYLSRIDTAETSTLYYMARQASHAVVTINGGRQQVLQLDPSAGVGSVSVSGRIGSVKWEVPASGTAITYLGATMENNQGIVVDNFSLRSSSGYQLEAVADQTFAELDRVRHYDLVVLMYGLNVVDRRRSDYSKYVRRMGVIIERMKRNMPGTGFLVISVADRGERTAQGVVTMPGIRSLVHWQQKLAVERDVAFWNMWEAMGGEGGIVRMVGQKPRMANLDYTHINFIGGRYLGALLAESIEWGYRQYVEYKNSLEGQGGAAQQ